MKKIEVESLKCEMKESFGFSKFVLHDLNFIIAATIRKNFEVLGI